MFKNFKRKIVKLFNKNYNLILLKNGINPLVHEVRTNNSSTRRLLEEINWGNIFNTSIRGNVWFDGTPLNVGRWAGNYSFFYVLFRILNDVKPENVLEMGLGESTKMIQAYKKEYQPLSKCFSIEHSAEWIDIKKNNGISEDYISIEIIEIAGQIINGHTTLMYTDLVDRLKSLNTKFNLIVVDGPFGSLRYSRYNIVDIVKSNLLAKEFIIIMDDVERDGERQTLEHLKLALDDMQISYKFGYYSGLKDQAVLVSENFRYLTSL